MVGKPSNPKNRGHALPARIFARSLLGIIGIFIAGILHLCGAIMNFPGSLLMSAASAIAAPSRRLAETGDRWRELHRQTSDKP